MEQNKNEKAKAAPTLMIGIGGTGCKVVDQIKRRLQEVQETQPHLIAIDLDEEKEESEDGKLL